MAVFGKRFLATVAVVLAVFGYYATLSVPPNLSSSDNRTLRITALFMDLVSIHFCVIISGYNFGFSLKEKIIFLIVIDTP